MVKPNLLLGFNPKLYINLKLKIMKRITMFMLAFVLTASFSFGQNLINNPDFENGTPGDAVPSWSGFKNRIANDDIVSGQVGQIENGDGSLFQEFSVTPGQTYDVNLEYRWIGSAGGANANLTMRIKEVGNLSNNLDLIGANNGDGNGYTLDSDLDVWKTVSFSFTVPAGITDVRLLMFKGNGNKSLNVDNVDVSQNLSTDNFDRFQFETYPNPVRDILNISANTSIDKVELYNLLGNQVKSINLNSRTNQISLSDLSQGVYILRTYIQGNISTQKLIKN